MAKTLYEYPVESISGRINKNEKRSPVHRRKAFRDEYGNIIGYGVNESYLVTQPRDYKKKPPTGAELANITTFRQAATQAKQELADPERRAYWTTRWHAQLQEGEADAPIDPLTHKPKIYLRLDKFVVSVLYRNIKTPPLSQHRPTLPT